MPWIELHHGFAGHRKVGELARALGVERRIAIGTLACLWSWAVAMVRHGDITGQAEEIAHATYFRGEPEQLMEALVSTGWVDRDEASGTLTIHDWEDYAGRYEAAKANARQRKQAERERRKAEGVTVTSRGRHADGHGDVTVTSRKTDRDGHGHVTPYMYMTNTSTSTGTETEAREHPSRGVSAPADAHARTHEADPYLAAAFGTEAPAPEAPTKAADVPVEAVEAPQAGTRKPRGAALVPEALRVIWGSLPAKARVEPDKTAKAWRHALTNPHPLNPTPSEPELVAKVLAWAKSEHVARGFVVPLHAWLAKGRWVEDWEGQPAGGQALAVRQVAPQGKSTEFGSAVTGGALTRVEEARARLAAKAAAAAAIEVKASEVTG